MGIWLHSTFTLMVLRRFFFVFFFGVMRVVAVTRLGPCDGSGGFDGTAAGGLFIKADRRWRIADRPAVFIELMMIDGVCVCGSQKKKCAKWITTGLPTAGFDDGCQCRHFGCGLRWDETKNKKKKNSLKTKPPIPKQEQQKEKRKTAKRPRNGAASSPARDVQ